MSLALAPICRVMFGRGWLLNQPWPNAPKGATQQNQERLPDLAWLIQRGILAVAGRQPLVLSLAGALDGA